MQKPSQYHHGPHPFPFYAHTFLTRLSGLARAAQRGRIKSFTEQARDNTHVSVRFRIKPISGGTTISKSESTS